MCDTDIANLSGLRELIRERLEQFCGYDTSSIRTEQAREVMRSTEYVLRAGLAGRLNQITARTDLCIDAVSACECFDAGIAALNERLDRARGLLAFARETKPDVRNTALEHTLGAGLDAFFARHDVYFGAHETPGDIDYPLCLPIGENVCGLDYIKEYLRRLTYENLWLQEVDKDELNGLLNARFASPRELIYNIFSVALEDMLIRLLKRKAPLVLSEHGSEYSLGQAEAAARLAAAHMDGAAAEYVHRAAIDAMPYVSVRAVQQCT